MPRGEWWGELGITGLWRGKSWDEWAGYAALEVAEWACLEAEGPGPWLVEASPKPQRPGCSSGKIIIIIKLQLKSLLNKLL